MEDIHSEILSLRHGNSGDWFLKIPEFQGWLTSRSGSIFWCTGEEGVGKTTMTAIAIQYAKDLPKYASPENNVVIYTYAKLSLSRSGYNSYSAEGVLRDLIHQLGSKEGIREQLTERLQNLYSVTSEITFRRGPDTAKYKEVFLALCDLYKEVTIFVDALDQVVHYDEVKFLLSTLETVAQKGGKVFVMTDADSVLNFAGHGAVKLCFSPSTSDIRSYIESDMPPAYSSRTPISEILNIATQWAGNSFLRAYLVIHVFKYRPQAIPLEILDDLQNLKGCDIYRILLGDLLKDTCQPAIVAKRILGWVMSADRAFRLSELCTALSWNAQDESQVGEFDEKSLVEATFGLLTVEPKTKIVSFKHPSIQHWFDVCEDAVRFSYHGDIAKNCLLYLMQDIVVESVAGVAYSTQERSGYREIASDTSADIELALLSYEDLARDLPFASYASHSWPFHLRKHDDTGLDDLVLGYLEKHERASSKQIEDDESRNIGKSKKIHHDRFRPLAFAATHGLETIVHKMFDDSKRWHIERDLQDAVRSTVSHGGLPVTKFLASRGADLHKFDANSRGLLHTAAGSGHSELLEWLLSYGLPVNGVAGRLHWTPLHEAVEDGEYDCAQLLLKYGADVQARDRWKGDAMTLATQAGRDDIIRLLIMHGYDMTVWQDSYDAPLFKAVYYGHTHIVEMFLAEEGSVYRKDKSLLCSLLQSAISADQPEVCRILLDYDADPLLQDADSNTPFEAALRKKSTEVSNMLLKAIEHREFGSVVATRCLKASISAAHIDITKRLIALVQYQGLVSLQTVMPGLVSSAVSSKNVEILRYVLQYMNGPLKQFLLDEQLLHVAVSECQPEMIRILLQHGADLHVSDEEGFTLLHHAAFEGQDDIIKILVDYNAKLDHRAKEGSTPLLVAATMRHPQTVKILALYGASIQIQNANGETCLHQAVLANDLPLAGFLLETGVDTAIQARDWSTALHLAAFLGYTDMMTILIQHGVDVDAQHSFVGAGYERPKYDWEGTSWRDRAYRGRNVQYQIEEGFTPLHSAAYGGHEDAVKILLDAHVDPSKRSSMGRTALHIAASCSHLDIVELLLVHTGGINDEDTDGNTVLHAASSLELAKSIAESSFGYRCDCSRHMASEGNLAKQVRRGIVEALLKNGADPYPQNGELQTPLECAALAKNEEAVRALIKFRDTASPTTRISPTTLSRLGQELAATGEYTILQLMSNIIDNSSDSASIWENVIYTACYNEKPQVVRLALRKGVILSPPLSVALLHNVIAIKNAWLVKLLLQAGANCDDVNQDGKNALHIACEHVGNTWHFGGRSRAVIARMLVSKSRSINTRTRNGDTALHLAVATADSTLVATLLELGASVRIRNKRQDTALHKAFSEIPSEYIVKNLLRCGASASAQNKWGATPLHMALTSERGISLVDHLVAYDADVSIRDNRGQTALHLAARRGNWGVANMLLLHGASAVETDNQGYTPLHNSAQNGHTSLFQLLIDNGADVNARTFLHKLSPLELSTRYDQPISMQWLLSRVRDVNDRNSENLQTPLHMAALKPSPEAVRLLLDVGANPDFKDKFHATSLQYAVEQCCYQAVELLCKAGANPNVLTKMSNPVAAAMENNDEKMLDLLLSFGARIDGLFTWKIVSNHDCNEDDEIASTSFGRDIEVTPLFVAAHRRNLGAAKILVTRGASFAHLAETIRTHFPPEEHQAYIDNINDVKLPLETEPDPTVMQSNSRQFDNESFTLSAHSDQSFRPIDRSRHWVSVSQLADISAGIDISCFASEDVETVNEYLRRCAVLNVREVFSSARSRSDSTGSGGWEPVIDGRVFRTGHSENSSDRYLGDFEIPRKSRTRRYSDRGLPRRRGIPVVDEDPPEEPGVFSIKKYMEDLSD